MANPLSLHSKEQGSGEEWLSRLPPCVPRVAANRWGQQAEAAVLQGVDARQHLHRPPASKPTAHTAKETRLPGQARWLTAAASLCLQHLASPALSAHSSKLRPDLPLPPACPQEHAVSSLCLQPLTSLSLTAHLVKLSVALHLPLNRPPPGPCMPAGARHLQPDHRLDGSWGHASGGRVHLCPCGRVHLPAEGPQAAAGAQGGACTG